MNPSGRDEESIASFEINTTTFLDHVAKKYITLLSRQSPLLVELQISLCWWYQPENLQIELLGNYS